MKILQVIDPAFGHFKDDNKGEVFGRALSEQGQRKRITVLLSGRSVYLAVPGDDDIINNMEPEFARMKKNADPISLIRMGIPVYVIREDLEEHCLINSRLIADVQIVSRSRLIDLYQSVDQIWYG